MAVRALAFVTGGDRLSLQAAGPAPSTVCAPARPAERAAEASPTPAGVAAEAVRQTVEEASACTDALLAGWFRSHVAELWRFVARLGVPAHSIDDVVQEAFLAAHRRQADISAGQARGFLFAAAVRLSSNLRQRAHVRRERSEGEQIEESPCSAPDAERLLMNKRLAELLERALAVLSDAHRAVFVLYELEGFSVPEISAMLELPLGTVASRLGRARARFSEIAAQLQAAHQEGP